MLKVLDSADILDVYDASSKYKGYSYLMILIPGDDNSYSTGNVYAISDHKGLRELMTIEKKLKEEGKEVIIGEGDDDGDFEDLEVVGYKVYG